MKRFCDKCWVVLALLLAVCSIPNLVSAQAGEAELRVYGYLQASFYEQMNEDSDDTNTFTVQQLDILLQKDLGRRWSAFVDLLLTNSYSSFRNWGTLELQQAWVRYRRGYFLNVKMGLLIPRFNALNEIKNKMPVLPYVIRPIVYETSFQEEVYLDEYVPQRAYVQAYGYIPWKDYKFDYAVYVGNSPNLYTGDAGQTGLDTTDTFLFGGRMGVRHTFFDVGFSATYDEVDYLNGVYDEVTPPLDFGRVPRVRLGGDLSVEVKNASLKGEFITVRYDEDDPVINVDKNFYYGTLGYRFSGAFFGYFSYWWLDQNLVLRTPPNDILTSQWRIAVPNFGVSYQMTDRITFKGQAARVIQKWSEPSLQDASFNFYAAAVSVMF